MTEEERTPHRVRMLERPTTRRNLLIGTAAVAAAGTTVAVVGLTSTSGNSSTSAAEGGEAQDRLTQGGTAGTKEPAEDANRPIADDRRRAAHLLRRAGFGGTIAQIEEFARLSREDAADRLVNFETVDNAALDARLAAMQLDLNDYGGRLISDMQRWWLTRMAYTARPLEERMTFTWHGLLTSQVSKVGPQRAKLLVTQNELFRTNALGRYDTLVKAVSKDPAMMNYLDTVESTKDHPNENYARELMELFTMGVGNYTEGDVRESARAFTGWRISPPPRTPIPANATDQERRLALAKDIADWKPQFIVQPRQHDTGTKTFLGKAGNWDGDDIVDIIMQHPATGRFMATRLFSEFAYADPDAGTVDRFAKVWDSSGHSVRDVVRAILVSDEFNSERAYRAKVRSPIEFVVGAMRGLELDSGAEFAGGPARNAGNNQAVNAYRGMDQILFEPHNVAGWPGGATWLSSSTFFARVNFLDSFLFPRGRAIPVPALAGATSADAMVGMALDRLVDGNVAKAARDILVEHASAVRPEDRPATVAYLVLASPEYQLI